MPIKRYHGSQTFYCSCNPTHVACFLVGFCQVSPACIYFAPSNFCTSKHLIGCCREYSMPQLKSKLLCLLGITPPCGCIWTARTAQTQWLLDCAWTPCCLLMLVAEQADVCYLQRKQRPFCHNAKAIKRRCLLHRRTIAQHTWHVLL